MECRNEAKLNIVTAGLCYPQGVQEPQRHVQQSHCLIIQPSVDLHGELVKVINITGLSQNVQDRDIEMLLPSDKFRTAQTQIWNCIYVLISVQLLSNLNC